MTRTRLTAQTATRWAWATEVVELMSTVDTDPWGRMSWSPYETARVTALAPWLPGQPQRIATLIDAQTIDGTWGEGPLAYRLIPTLSAVDALLTVLRDRRQPSWARQNLLVAGASAGLTALRAYPATCPRPDTAAAEIIVPGLVERVNHQLNQLALAELGAPLSLPAGYDAAPLARIRRRVANGGAVPAKLHHTFEAIADHCPPSVIPTTTALLGGSPAASAAWLRVTGTTQGEIAREIEAVSARYDGLFPEAAPFSAVERLWVLSALSRVGLPHASRSSALRWINTLYNPHGVCGVPGLPPDADDTAMSIHVAAALGAPGDPAPLDAFETPHHFACYVGEDTASVTANAHVLHALTTYLRHHPDRVPDYADAVAKARAWVLDQQTDDGCWIDKWHASPYYATAHCVAALAAHGDNHDSIAAAARWTEQTQSLDGSWGYWTPTLEETAYAIQILLNSHSTHTSALIRARTFMLESDDNNHQHPPLWHDKTLYAPHAIIHAELTTTLAMLTHALTQRPTTL